MKEKYYKLKTTLYSHNNGCEINNKATYCYDIQKKKSIPTSRVFAKKGEIFKIIDINEHDYEYGYLDEKYKICVQSNIENINYIIANKKDTKWYFAEDFKTAHEHFESMFCSYCLNATQCEDLDETNDFSSCGIGENAESRGTWLMLDSSKVGGVNIQARQVWLEKDGGDNYIHCVARYYPKYCPECGRLLKENKEYREDK